MKTQLALKGCDDVLLKEFREHWEIHRRPLENAITNTLKDSVGFGSYGMNVYIRRLDDEIAAGYFHNDNQVRLILQGLTLKDQPRVLLPEVKLSLASNVLKIRTKLSKMIVHADYSLIRNRTDVIYEPKDQDPYKSSPFLFQQVQDAGKIAIAVEDCKLSGFMLATLTGNSVHVGYEKLSLTNCQYTIEIYRPGEDSPPVIAKYNLVRKDEPGLGLTHLLLKPLLEAELMPKIQTALFTYVNTSAICGPHLEDYRYFQEDVFHATAAYLTGLVRKLNKATILTNNGAVDMEDYFIHWDDGSVHNSAAGDTLELYDMVLTGLETLYSAHIGGPFKIDSVMIAEELRFSSLQVRGKVKIKSKWSRAFQFATEINDVAIDLLLGISHEGNGTITGGNINVKGLRNMVFIMPKLIYETAESMISGYLMNVVPKLVHTHLAAILPEYIDNNAEPELFEGSDDSSEAGDYDKIGKDSDMKEFQRTNLPRHSFPNRTRKPLPVAHNKIRK